MNLADVQALIDRTPDNEWIDLELKRTTGEKRAAMETLCAFLNTRGGTVVFGAHPTTGRLFGQDVCHLGQFLQRVRGIECDSRAGDHATRATAL